MVKVLGFDGWTMGAHHYVRLLDTFAEKNIELVLTHLGSWGDDKGRKKEESINGLTVRDISYYGNSDFDGILALEQPDLVLFLSTETFAHRAFQRYCKRRGIPTLYLYHGLVSVTVFDGKNEPYRLNVLGQVKFVFRQAYKSLAHTFPAYAKSLFKTSAKFHEWIRFLQDITYRLMGKTIFFPAADSVATKCCVYTAADVQDATSRFKLSGSDIVVVGNPDLLAFGMTSESLGEMVAYDSSGSKNVMYIDSGMPSLGYNFKSEKEYGEYIIDLGNRLNLQHRNIMVKLKPHPVEHKEYMTDLLSKNNIEIVGNKEFIEKLKTCCACITEPSTLGLLPTLIGIPLFMARFGPMESLLYGNVFTEYPRAQYLDDISHFSELLLKEQALCDPDRVMGWINKNSGPMPAEDMPKRVAQVVLDTVGKNSNSICVTKG